MVTLKINGQDHAYDGETDVPLLWSSAMSSD
jgi:hypothetical protein